MRWDDVRHQDAALRRLEQAMRSGRLPHAMLFAGPEGVGKRMTALRLAQRILCSGRPLPLVQESLVRESLLTPTTAGIPLAPDAAPRQGSRETSALDACGRCDDCHAVETGMHLDLQIVERTMNRLHLDPLVRRRQANDLGVDVIRHFLIEPASRHPVRGRAKVFIIEEAERMNNAAENALLKTLEEPPGSSYLILLATSEDRLLPTTRSRCRMICFGRLPDDFVRAHLAQQLDLSEDDMAYLVGLADGRPGIALQCATAGLPQHRDRVLEMLGGVSNDPLAFSKAMQDLAKALAAGPAAEAEEADNDVEDGKEDEDDEEVSAERQAGDARALRAGRRLALTLLAMAMRDVLRTTLGQSPVAHPGERAIGALANRWSPAGTSQCIRAIADAETELERSANVSLVFDVLGIRLSRATMRRVA